MRYEKSCGAVVFTRADGEVKYLLVENGAGGSCGFPKGHMEGTETERETALREIREETALDVRFFEGFRTADAYRIPGTDIFKQVVYFLAEYEGQTPTPRAGEIASIEVLPFPEAEKRLTFEGAREILRAADAFLAGGREKTAAPELSSLKLKDLQPSQFYISEKKLADIEKRLFAGGLAGAEPIPVKLLDGVPVMTDGHTRAVAALRAGLESYPLTWDGDELDRTLYRKCVKECRLRQVFSPLDLLPRVISAGEYEEKWNRWCDGMQKELVKKQLKIVRYTEKEIPDALDFERRLREEEDVWGWEIDDRYIESVSASFHDGRFNNALSLLAYYGGSVVGRIDAVLLPTHFDGSVKAYLDWICVVKSCRHRGVWQALLEELKSILKEKGVDTLIALTASNEEAQSFYRSIPDAVMRDTGIWIDIK